MSKIFGYVLLVGLVGSVLLSIGLLMYEWSRSTNAPQDPIKTTPAPTTKGAIQSPENLGFSLVDARQGVASVSLEG